MWNHNMEVVAYLIKKSDKQCECESDHVKTMWTRKWSCYLIMSLWLWHYQWQLHTLSCPILIIAWLISRQPFWNNSLLFWDMLLLKRELKIWSAAQLLTIMHAAKALPEPEKILNFNFTSYHWNFYISLMWALHQHQRDMRNIMVPMHTSISSTV